MTMVPSLNLSQLPTFLNQGNVERALEVLRAHHIPPTGFAATIDEFLQNDDDVTDRDEMMIKSTKGEVLRIAEEEMREGLKVAAKSMLKELRANKYPTQLIIFFAGEFLSCVTRDLTGEKR